MTQPIWLVITIFTQVAMSVGPLPYGMAECQLRANQKAQEIHAQFEQGLVLPQLPDGRQPTEADIKIHCVKADRRPELHSILGAE